MIKLSEIPNKLLELKKIYPMMYFFQVHRNHKNQPLKLDRHYYQKEIYKDNNPYITIKKSTQNGISEYLIIHAISKAISGSNVMYVLPTLEIRNRFVTNRFEKSILFTPTYQEILQGNTDNRGIKSFGSGVINFIGSNAESMFTEFQADTVIIDELDQCNQNNLAMVSERQSASYKKSTIKISNPTIPDYGIDYEFNKTDKKIWKIKCDHCNKWVHMDFFNHVVEKVENDYILRDKDYEWGMDRDIHVICDCGKPLDRYKKGVWDKQQVSSISGYHMSKLFSGNVTIQEIVDRFNDGLVNNRKMERFYNGDLGLAFTSEGAKITESMLDECVGDYNEYSESKDPCVIGIDVGTYFNVIIGKFLPDDKIQIIRITEIKEEERLFDLFNYYNIISGVIDGLPETRLSRKLSANQKGVFISFYGGKMDSISVNRKTVTSDRTASLDGVKEAILKKTILLPKNARSIEGFYSQLTASVRVWNEDREEYTWTEGNNPDHFHHALNYLLMARKLLISAR